MFNVNTWWFCSFNDYLFIILLDSETALQSLQIVVKFWSECNLIKN